MGRLQAVFRTWNIAVNKEKCMAPTIDLGSYIGRLVAMPSMILRQSKVSSSGVQQAATVYLST